jgi:hypothetical protein
MPACRRLGLAATLLVSLVFGPALTGCDIEDEDRPVVVAESFTEGMAKDSDDGAFRVALSSDEGGLRVGPNTLVVRLGFHDPNDPLALGRGIPGAEVRLDAWMPHGTGEVLDLRGIYVEDGRYEIALDLPAPGVWQLDFQFAVGSGVSDSVSFAFIIDEPPGE